MGGYSRHERLCLRVSDCGYRDRQGQQQSSASAVLPGQTDDMASKYDGYWTGQLDPIRAALRAAAAGTPAVVVLPGLRRLGARQSWYGVAEVRGREVVRSSMAHATSLGKTVARSGACERWPGNTFRFTMSADGGVLTITTAKEARTWPAETRRQHHLVPDHESQPSQSAERAKSSPRSYAPGRAGDRQADTDEFYRLLDDLARRLGGPRHLRDCNRRSGWPRQGIYFFYEDGETRADGSCRVVRVGTHALTATAKSTLWGRLRQHRGQLAGRNPGGGNHRASVFRRHVGAALIRSSNSPNELLASWLNRHRPVGERASQEALVEVEVSRYIGAMPFLWLAVSGWADRAYIERNSIALLSCLTGGLDPPSASWLGHYAQPSKIRNSGLWNINHVNDQYKPEYLRRLAQLVDQH
jgi:hypothetical protein